MEKIIIIGAGGHGKVILDILLKQKQIENNFEIMGFLDDSRKEKIMDYSVIGTLNDIQRYENDNNILFALAFGDNKTREKIVKKNPKLKYKIIIHPSSVIGKEVEIGEGTVIKANSVINIGTKIGRHCIINSLVSIEQDTIVEDFVHIYPNVSVYGENKIKKGITLFSNSSTEQGAIIKRDLSYGEHYK